MERYNLVKLTKIIYESDLRLFTLKTLKDLIGVKKESTLFNIIKRLILSDVLIKIEKNKYMLKGEKVDDFTLANFLYPSYISFESALNFYGIISQFPYEISSATVGKNLSKTINNKSFVYYHIQKSLFWGYEKKGGFLIALPEKALLDQMYFAAKGLKKLHFDEYDLSSVNLRKLRYFIKKYPVIRQFKSLVSKYKKFIQI